jgi:hypothetical protein
MRMPRSRVEPLASIRSMSLSVAVAPAGSPNVERLCPVAMLGWASGVTPGLMRSGVIEFVMIPPTGSVRPDGGDRGRPATTTS